MKQQIMWLFLPTFPNRKRVYLYFGRISTLPPYFAKSSQISLFWNPAYFFMISPFTIIENFTNSTPRNLIFLERVKLCFRTPIKMTIFNLPPKSWQGMHCLFIKELYVDNTMTEKQLSCNAYLRSTPESNVQAFCLINAQGSNLTLPIERSMSI